MALIRAPQDILEKFIHLKIKETQKKKILLESTEDLKKKTPW